MHGRCRIPIATLLGLVTLVASALPARSLEIEVKGGASFTRIVGDDFAPRHDKRGLAAGLALHFPLRAGFSLQTEILYVMKGNYYGPLTNPTVGGTTYYGTFDEYIALDYIELPVLLRSSLPWGPVRPVAMAGGVVAWKALEHWVLRDFTGEDVQYMSYAGRGFDLLATGGLGLEFGPRERCFTLEGRYTRSLMDIQRDDYPGDYQNSDYRVTAGLRTRWKSPFDLR